MKPVWIVDDDRSIRWVLEKALEREGIPFKSFVSAYEVLQAFDAGDPCALVSDIRMPGESGLQLLDKELGTGEGTRLHVSRSIRSGAAVSRGAVRPTRAAASRGLPSR